MHSALPGLPHTRGASPLSHLSAPGGTRMLCLQVLQLGRAGKGPNGTQRLPPPCPRPGTHPREAGWDSGHISGLWSTPRGHLARLFGSLTRGWPPSASPGRTQDPPLLTGADTTRGGCTLASPGTPTGSNSTRQRGCEGAGSGQDDTCSSPSSDTCCLAWSKGQGPPSLSLEILFYRLGQGTSWPPRVLPTVS